MNNKLNLIIILVGFLTAIVGWVLSTIENNVEVYYRLFNGGLVLAKFASVALLVRNSNLFSLVYGWIFQACAGLIFLGAIIKILHLPGANQVLFLALLIIPVSYLVRFLKKEQKRRLDIIKLLWVTAACVSGVLFLGHWVSREILYVPDVLFWLMVLDFVITGWKENTLFKSAQKKSKLLITKKLRLTNKYTITKNYQYYG